MNLESWFAIVFSIFDVRVDRNLWFISDIYVVM